MATRQFLLTLETTGRGFVNLTPAIGEKVAESGIQTGLAHCFIQHTSASLVLTENADPDVLADMESWMSAAVQDGDAAFLHRAEGPDDMSAHIRSVLTGSDFSLPVTDGKLNLGTWQALYLWEHRYRPQRRRVVVTVTG